ncbi:hypothetical protein HN51_032170 [Arachis hypogaea]|uniref:Alginate lyase 2 domain-containing protein n=1 Tax=Arachis hypogaea TaxID=3818 RepID=A0A445B5G9_ARAHY|nr:citrate-binding protein-like [Arachis hypogaea]RYR33927.1 hypothetical protein Ahy_A10g048609 [Arachis hypogaea]
MGTVSEIRGLIILICFSLIMDRTGTSAVNYLTLGFTELPLNSSNLHNHKPYNLPVNARYSFKHGVHKFWLYSTDKPLSLNSTTRPRSEIRIRGYDYSHGVWQFEGYGFVPYGTSGVCIMQVFGAHPKRATTLMLRMIDGWLAYYGGPFLVPNMWERWFRLNVIHDVEASIVKVYVDGVQVFQAPGHGGSFHYFKFGLYAQPNASYYMESRWKGIRVLKKDYY